MYIKNIILFLIINFCLGHFVVAGHKIVFTNALADYCVTLPISLPYQSIFLDSSQNQTNEKKRIVKFELRLGLNKSNTNFNKGFPTPITPVETTWKGGLIGGFALQIYVWSKFYVQQEYLYSQMGGSVNDLSIDYKLNYISLPVLFNYKLGTHFIVKAGSQFDLLVSAGEYDNDKFSNITHETESRNIGLIVGWGFLLSKKLSIDARFMQGINHVGIKQRTVTREFKYESVQLTLNYFF